MPPPRATAACCCYAPTSVLALLQIGLGTHRAAEMSAPLPRHQARLDSFAPCLNPPKIPRVRFLTLAHLLTLARPQQVRRVLRAAPESPQPPRPRLQVHLDSFAPRLSPPNRFNIWNLAHPPVHAAGSRNASAGTPLPGGFGVGGVGDPLGQVSRSSLEQSVPMQPHAKSPALTHSTALKLACSSATGFSCRLAGGGSPAGGCARKELGR